MIWLVTDLLMFGVFWLVNLVCLGESQCREKRVGFSWWKPFSCYNFLFPLILMLLLFASICTYLQQFLFCFLLSCEIFNSFNDFKNDDVEIDFDFAGSWFGKNVTTSPHRMQITSTVLGFQLKLQRCICLWTKWWWTAMSTL